jgi:hypothetical protein
VTLFLSLSDYTLKPQQETKVIMSSEAKGDCVNQIHHAVSKGSEGYESCDLCKGIY